MAEWSGDDNLASTSADNNLNSNAALNWDPFELDSESHMSTISDPFSISTLKVELGELQDGGESCLSREHTAERFSFSVSTPPSMLSKESQSNVTYFNKGQAYEITLQCKTPSRYHGCLIECNILLRLQEKKLQAKERFMFDQWNSENSSRLLEADSLSCVNAESVINDTLNPNSVHVVWDPAKTCSFFLKVHCLSGDFTKRKHSGEKGVPFLLCIDTYLQVTDKASKYLCTTACILKIFQNKGAERKHRNDTKQIQKLSQQEKGQLVRSSDVTFLKPIVRTFDKPGCSYSDAYNSSGYCADNSKLSDCYSDPDNEVSSPKKPCIGETRGDVCSLTSRSSVHDTLRWLRNNRFNNYLQTFNNYAGCDLLRLSRNDLKDLMGVTDGIRLHNALQNRALACSICLYVLFEGSGAPSTVYQAIYLESLTYRELMSKVCATFNIDPNTIVGIQKSGPSGISIAVTDDVVRHLANDACFVFTLLNTDRAGMCIIHLK